MSDFSWVFHHLSERGRRLASASTLLAYIPISYFATEIKTNLDKTMFQEAAATAGELKRVSSGSKYVLLCEWFDMTPINTKLTAMDEVIVLRRAKRLGSNQRSNFSTAEGRCEKRQWYSVFWIAIH